jgi:hypothetical protein
MIKPIQHFIDDCRRWTIALGAMVFFYIVFRLSAIYEFSFGWYLLSIPLIYYIFIVLDRVLIYALYRFSGLRKMILGKNWIEGDWIEVLYDKGKMDSIAILQIVYEKQGSYTLKGESYTLTGEYRGSFVTPNTTYHEDERALRYSYSGKLKEALIAGTGVLEFKIKENEKVAEIFEGHLLDNFHTKGATFKAEKIDDYTKIDSLRSKKDFMREYISKQILHKKEKVNY